MRFIGRQKELKQLQILRQKRSASLVVLRGRRRIGKSRLAQEFAKEFKSHFIFSGIPPTDGVTAQIQRDEFAKQMQRLLNIPLPRSDDWGDLFWSLARFSEKEEVLIVFDEITWMGSKDPTFLGKLKNAWDLYFVNNPKLILILSGSVSSWIDKNILSSTGFVGRVSLDIYLNPLPLSDCNKFWHPCENQISSYEKFKVLSVTGGVPRYLEEIIPELPAEQNIRRLCFVKGGLLFEEFEKIFSDLFLQRNELYRQIVQSLTDGPRELTEIARILGREKSGVLSEYLDDLVNAGFISRDYTWHLKSGKESKLSHYRLSDNYIRFYLKHIVPNKQKIEHESLLTIPAWYSIMGLQFENLVLNNRKSLWHLLGIPPDDVVCDNPYYQRKTQSAEGCQVDYLIQTRFDTLYVCDVKFSKQEIQSDCIQQIQDKIRKIHAPKHFSFRPVLIHVNGVCDAVIESGFFSHCVDFSQLFQSS